MKNKYKKFVKKAMNSNNTKETDNEREATLQNDETVIAKEQNEIENELKFSDAEVKAEEKIEETPEETRSDAEVKLAETETKLAESNDKYVRLAAEFDNYRRRAAKDRLDLISTASEDVIKGLLPVLDDCQRALQVLKESDAPQSAIEGTELILNKMSGFLKTKGLVQIEAKGKDFDTDDMEAVTQFPAPDPSMKGKVIDVVQEGYTLNGKVIRFAKVVVGA